MENDKIKQMREATNNTADATQTFIAAGGDPVSDDGLRYHLMLLARGVQMLTEIAAQLTILSDSFVSDDVVDASDTAYDTQGGLQPADTPYANPEQEVCGAPHPTAPMVTCIQPKGATHDPKVHWSRVPNWMWSRWPGDDTTAK